MHKANPPFRAEHVGSFLRPPEVRDARARHERGELDAAGLRTIEDGAIERLIRRQEESGLQGVTDGEFRRAFWHYDFLQALDGVETYYVEQGIQFKGAALKPVKLKKDFFTVGSKAKDKDDYQIFDPKKKVLLYDADGSGKGAAYQIAVFDMKLKLTMNAAEFLVI